MGMKVPGAERQVSKNVGKIPTLPHSPTGGPDAYGVNVHAAGAQLGQDVQNSAVRLAKQREIKIKKDNQALNARLLNDFKNSSNDFMYSQETISKNIDGVDYEMPKGIMLREEWQSKGTTKEWEEFYLQQQNELLEKANDQEDLFNQLEAVNQAKIPRIGVREAAQSKADQDNSYKTIIGRNITDAYEANTRKELDVLFDEAELYQKELDPDGVEGVFNKIADKAISGAIMRDPSGFQAEALLESIQDKIEAEQFDKLKKSIGTKTTTMKKNLDTQEKKHQYTVGTDFVNKLANNEIGLSDEEHIKDMGVKREMSQELTNAAIKTIYTPITEFDDAGSDLAFTDLVRAVLNDTDIERKNKNLVDMLDGFNGGTLSQRRLQLLVQTAAEMGLSVESGDTKKVEYQQNMESIWKWAEEAGVEQAPMTEDLLETMMKDYDPKTVLEDIKAMEVQRQQSSNEKEIILDDNLSQQIESSIDTDAALKSSEKDVYQYLLKTGKDQNEAAATAQEIFASEDVTEIAAKMAQAMPELKYSMPKTQETIKKYGVFDEIMNRIGPSEAYAAEPEGSEESDLKQLNEQPEDVLQNEFAKKVARMGQEIRTNSLNYAIDILSGGMTVEEAEDRLLEYSERVAPYLPEFLLTDTQKARRQIEEDLIDAQGIMARPLNAFKEIGKTALDFVDFAFGPILKRARAIGGAVAPEADDPTIKERLQQVVKDTLQDPGAGIYAERIADDMFKESKKEGFWRNVDIASAAWQGYALELATLNPRGAFSTIKQMRAGQQAATMKQVMTEIEKDMPAIQKMMQENLDDTIQQMKKKPSTGAEPGYLIDDIYKRATAEIKIMTPEKVVSIAKTNPAAGNYVKGLTEKVAPRFSLHSEAASLRFGLQKGPLKSNVQAAAQYKLPATVGGVQALKTLSKGVSPEEIQSMGLDKFLESKDKFTRDEIVDFIDKNKVQVEPVVKTTSESSAIEDTSEVSNDDLLASAVDAHPGLQAMQEQGITAEYGPDGFIKLFDEDANTISDLNQIVDEEARTEARQLLNDTQSYLDDAREVMDDLNDDVSHREIDDTKYGRYVEPGGTNYQETVITLPTKAESAPVKETRQLTVQEDDEYNELFNKLSDEYAEGDDIDIDEARDVIDRAITGDQEAMDRVEGLINSDSIPALGRLSELQALISDTGTIVKSSAYKSSHWDEDNPLVHHRTNQRVDADGKTGTFVEEIQSDWHREGKAKGYNTDTEKMKQMSADELILEPGLDGRQKDYLRDFSKRWESIESTGTDAELDALTEEYQSWVEKETTAVGVPDAPFKKTWHELALKDIIRQAVDRGDKFVAFVSGKQTADRYSLSKQVDDIQWRADGDERRIEVNVTNSGVMTFWIDEQGIVTRTMSSDNNDWKTKHITDIVGKEIGDKIVASHSTKPGIVEGDDLDIGGNWAKTFYDQILPRSAAKYIKKWGGKIEDIELGEAIIGQPQTGPTGEMLPRETGTLTQKGFYITPQMAKEVKEVGQPLFGNRLAGIGLEKLSNKRGTAGVESNQDLPDDMPEKPAIFDELNKSPKVNKITKDDLIKSTPDEEIPAEILEKAGPLLDKVNAVQKRLGFDIKRGIKYIEKGDIPFNSYYRSQAKQDAMIASGEYPTATPTTIHSDGVAIDLPSLSIKADQVKIAEAAHAEGLLVEKISETPKHVHVELDTPNSKLKKAGLLQEFDDKGKVVPPVKPPTDKPVAAGEPEDFKPVPNEDGAQHLVKPDSDLNEAFSDVADVFFGERDTRIFDSQVEKRALQNDIKKTLGIKKYDQNAKDIDQAIHLAIDSKRNPDHAIDLFDKLTDEQKKIVDLSQNLPPAAQAIVDKIEASYKQVGLEALDAGVIRNVLDNYAARVWDLENKSTTELGKKFGATTRHAKQRKFETIVEGMSEGYDLKVKSATNNLQILKEEISKAIASKHLIQNMKGAKDLDGNPLATTKHIEGYQRIEVPNFNEWKYAGEVKEGKSYGKNFFINDNMLFERQDLYAPKDIAKRINNIFGKSGINQIPGVKTLTKYNAMAKAWILQSSLFHHLAFTRSFYLGTNQKKFGEMDIRQSYRAGIKSIENSDPNVRLGVKNGLTLGVRQDWEENLLQEKTAIGDMIDKVPGGEAVKDKILGLRQAQADFLFGEFGAGLKAKAFLIELRNHQKAHPDLSADQAAKDVANLINDDFGGLHLERMERNPTLQHVFRLFMLAPDWTESNIRTMIKSVKAGSEAETDMYRKFWAGILVKGTLLTAAANMLMASFDEDDAETKGTIEKFFRNYKRAWKEGNLKVTKTDITPIYKLFGGRTNRRKYFSILGHFTDPMKFILHPIKSAKHKGSVLFNFFYDAVTGTDWSGRRFTTFNELIGQDKEKGLYKTSRKGKYKKGDPKYGKLKGQTVTFDYKRHPLTYEQMPSYVVNKIKGVQPVQLQNLMAWMMGEMEGFDALMNSAGLGVSSTYGDDDIDDKKESDTKLKAKKRTITSPTTGKERSVTTIKAKERK